MIERLTNSQLNTLAKMQKLVDDYNKLPQNKRKNYNDYLNQNDRYCFLQDATGEDGRDIEISAEILPEWAFCDEDMEHDDILNYYSKHLNLEVKDLFKTNLKLNIFVDDYVDGSLTYSKDEYLEEFC